MTNSIDLNVRAAHIKKQACFSQFTDKEVEDLAGLLEEKAFKRGETIVTEGAIVDSAYIIISGNADVRHVFVQDGKLEFTSIATLGEGKAIGLSDYGFYSLSGVRTATVVALSDMITLRLGLAAFRGFSMVNAHVSAVMRKNAEDMLRTQS